MNRRVVWATMLSICIALVMVSCAGMQNTKPTEANFKAPVIKLESFEVPQYDGWWYYAKTVAPTKGTAGNNGAPLPLSFLFSVQNPNPYPVLLEGVKFTVAFDKEFELVTVNNADSNWIPANHTDQVRMNTMITAVTGRDDPVGGLRLQIERKGMGPMGRPGAMVERRSGVYCPRDHQGRCLHVQGGRNGQGPAF